MAAAPSGPAYRRVLLKLSGEALMGAQGYGIDHQVAHSVADQIQAAHGLGAWGSP